MDNCTIFFYTVFFIIHQPEIVYTTSRAVKRCEAKIINDFNYRKDIKSPKLNQNIAQHAFLFLTEEIVATLSEEAKSYFSYLEDQIYVDNRLEDTINFCEKIGINEDPVMEEYFTDQKQQCKRDLFNHFLISPEPLEVAKDAFLTTLETDFRNLPDTDYALRYYYFLKDYIKFQGNLRTPVSFCEHRQTMALLKIPLQNTFEWRKEP